MTRVASNKRSHGIWSRRSIAVGVLGFLMLLFTGCAASTLSVNIDLYDEDPTVDPPMSPDGSRRLLTDLQNLQVSAAREHRLQLEVATRSNDLFRSTWQTANGSADAVERLATRFDDYEASFVQPMERFKRLCQLAKDETEAYMAAYDEAYTVLWEERKDERRCKDPAGCEPDNDSALDAPPDAGDGQIIRNLPIQLKTHEGRIMRLLTEVIAAYWEQRESAKPFFVNWVELESLLSARYELAKRKGNETEKQLVLGLTKRVIAEISSLTSQIASYGGDRRGGGESVRLPGSATGLFESARAVGIELESLRTDLPANATSTTALSGLVQRSSRFIELIDRLQDSSNPVWRTVSDPANEAHWNTHFTETYFFASGDSGIVLVRDNPMRFRVQSARNDPTALIEGQLGIARTLTNAALSVAGAASGLPVGGLAAANQTAAAAEGGPTENSFPARKAIANERAEVRARVLASLRRNLAQLSRELSSGTDSAAATARKIRRLQSILNGHKPLLSVAPE